MGQAPDLSCKGPERKSKNLSFAHTELYIHYAVGKDRVKECDEVTNNTFNEVNDDFCDNFTFHKFLHTVRHFEKLTASAQAHGATKKHRGNELNFLRSELCQWCVCIFHTVSPKSGVLSWTFNLMIQKR